MTDTATVQDDPQAQYAFWRRRLAGEDIPIHDGEYQAGFYRNNRKDGTSDAVAIWFKHTIPKCKIGSRMVNPDNVYDVDSDAPKTTLGDLWTFVSAKPVSHEDYKVKIDTGNWPGENAVVSMSNMAPADDSYEGIQAQIEELAREAERLMKLGPAKTKAQADEASDVADKLGKLSTKADNLRKVEKQPFLDGGRAIDDKWNMLTGAAAIYKRLKDAVVEPFLKAQKALKERAEREARQKAEEAQREAARVAQEAQRKIDEAARKGDTAAAEKAQATADAAAKVATDAEATANAIAATPITAGTRGHKTALRSKTVVTITDRDAVLTFFKDRPELTELLQSMAERAVKAGMQVPGVSIGKEQDAA